MRFTGAGAMLLIATVTCGSERAESYPSVDLVLILLVDVSGSMPDSALDLQRDGYVAAFQDPDLARAIALGRNHTIAVAYVEWAGPLHQEVIIPCTIVANRVDALRFSRNLAASKHTRGQGTSISAALIFAQSLARSCPVAPSHLVIDVSGDGPSNIGPDILSARNVVIASGATINGLPVIAPKAPPSSRAPNGHWLSSYYEYCVAGGPGAFVMPVDDPMQLPVTILRKLVLEIAMGKERLYHAREERRTAFDCHLIGQRPGR